ncbi:MAG: protoporphyrinogen oxidase [Thermoprotei archaeon]|nr:MAG: protoporphyrinogen oxidase [Thermoprotei archaeon]
MRISDVSCRVIAESMRYAIVRHINYLTIVLNPDLVYNPAEDTFLILDHVNLKGNCSVLDMGTGCGVIGLSLARSCVSVLGADINPYAVFYANLNALINNVRNFKAIVSNLFSEIKGVFDYIVFNPPYLEDTAKDVLDLSWAGGTGLVKRFLREARNHVRDKIFLVVTEQMFERLTWDHYRVRVVAEKAFFFEKILLLELTPTL